MRRSTIPPTHPISPAPTAPRPTAPGPPGRARRGFLPFARLAQVALGIVTLAGLAACSTTRGASAPSRPASPPSFTLSLDDAAADLARMAADPRPLSRPLVVLGGYRSPTSLPRSLADALMRTLAEPSRQDVLVIAYPLVDTFPDAARLVVDTINARWPAADADETVEVDVVAISMGGLVARLAATRVPITTSERAPRPGDSPPDPSPARRLRMARLITLAAPHQGSILADTVAIDPMTFDMKPGSGFITELNSALAQRAGGEYELICYARTRDDIVGARHAAPPGADPLWLHGPGSFSHQTIQEDRRLIADIARRLRGEPPLARPTGPPPTD